MKPTDKEKTNVVIDPLEKDINDAIFLKRALNRTNLVVVLALLVAFTSTSALVIKILSTENKYFTVDAGGRVISLTPLNRSLVTDAAARQFATDVARDIFSLNYRDYKRQLSDIERKFSEIGYENLLISLETRIDDIKKSTLYSHAIIDGVPVLIRKGLHNGTYKWKFELKIKVFYEGSKKRKVYQNVIATIRLKRADNRSNTNGIVVYSFITESTK